MSIKFHLICEAILIIGYFLYTPLNKYLTYCINQSKKIFLHDKKRNRKDCDRIGKIYSFILLFLLVLIITHCIYTKYNPHSRTVFGGVNKQVLKIGLPILYFLLGLLCANGKKLIYYFYDDYFYIVKSLLLTGSSINLLVLQRSCIPSLMIIITLFNSIMIIDYFQFFKKRKDNMKTLEFIFHFSWLLIINFLNSFILIYNIWNI